MTITDEPAPGTARGRWLVGPPRWIFGAALLATIALTFYAVAPPGGIFDLAMTALCAWVALCVTFVVRLIVALVNEGERRRFRRRALLWLAFPVILVANFAATSAGVPGHIALELAKGDMVAYARDPAAPEPDRVGPYEILRADRLPNDGARFQLKGTGFLDSTGWAYSPAGAPPSVVDDITYTSIGNGWYTFVRRF
jgi:hypothetical protein